MVKGWWLNAEATAKLKAKGFKEGGACCKR